MNRQFVASALSVWVALVRGRWALGTVLAIGLAGTAAAEPSQSSISSGPPLLTIDGQVARRIAIDTPVTSYKTQNALVSQTIYLQRCSGGCPVRAGDNDARNYISSVLIETHVSMGTIAEFANSMGQIGAAADDEWRQVLKCMQEVYSPFAVVVTDQPPTSGLSYHMAIVAGRPESINLAPDVLGVAPLANDCRAMDNVISFSFANLHMGNDRLLNICWTAAQESAHAFGLDHEYSFTTGNPANNHSACNDPMTYRTDCGGQKFFRNEDAKCGRTSVEPCRCGTSQNSHLKILSVFGSGTPSTGVPSATVMSPAAGTMVAAGQVVALQAGSRRGVSHVDLYYNDYKWAQLPGAAFGAQGQPNPSAYAIRIPSDLPDSIVDVKAIAYDDLGASKESDVVTVTKGGPCASASSCAKGQKCEAGKCFWDPPTAEIGTSCSYNQFCKSGLCTGTQEEQICTQMCAPGTADACPDGLECVMSGPGTGVCFFSDSGGCCSVGADRAWWVHIGLAAVALAWVTRRRRRR